MLDLTSNQCYCMFVCRSLQNEIFSLAENTVGQECLQNTGSATNGFAPLRRCGSIRLRKVQNNTSIRDCVSLFRGMLEVCRESCPVNLYSRLYVLIVFLVHSRQQRESHENRYAVCSFFFAG